MYIQPPVSTSKVKPNPCCFPWLQDWSGLPYLHAFRAIWEAQGEVTWSYEQFTSLIKEMFDHPSEIRASGEELFKIHQGNKPAAEYALTFSTLVAQRGLNIWAFITAYRWRLQEEIQKELACRDEALTLNHIISLSIRLDNLPHERKPHYSNPGKPCLSCGCGLITADTQRMQMKN